MSEVRPREEHRPFLILQRLPSEGCKAQTTHEREVMSTWSLRGEEIPYGRITESPLRCPHEWQPIETAPKDATRILGYDPNYWGPGEGSVGECSWFGLPERWQLARSPGSQFLPALWQPMPELPKRDTFCHNCGSSNLVLQANAYGETYRPIVCRDCKAVQTFS